MAKTDFKKLFLSLGFKADQLPADETDTDIDYDKVGTDLHNALVVAIDNDPKKQKEHADAAFGRVSNEVQRKLIKKFGLQFENPEDGQVLDKVIDAAHATVRTQSAKSAQEIQQQLIDKEKEILTIKEQHEVELGNERNKVVTFKRNVAFDQTVHGALNRLNNPEKKVKLATPAEINIPFMKQELEKQYAIVFENDAIELRRKDKPEMKVTDGAKVITLDDAVATIAEKNNLLSTIEPKKKSFDFGKGETGQGEASSEGMKRIQERTAAK